MEIVSFFLAVITAGVLGYGESAYPTTTGMVVMMASFSGFYIIDAIIRAMMGKNRRNGWDLKEVIFWVALAYGLERVQNYNSFVNRLPVTGWIGALMTILEFILVLFVCRWTIDGLYFLKEKVRKHYEALN